MSIEAKIGQHIRALATEGNALSIGDMHGQVLNDSHRERCSAWLAAAQNAIHLVAPSPANPYRQKADRICEADWGLTVQSAVGTLAGLMERLVADAEAGLLTSVADAARAETFDNFLDHAESYLHDGREKESGVIAGVVFEDTIRRICEKQHISQQGVKLDLLITQLAKDGVLSTTKAKRARAAADVRTKATHAQWSEYRLADVASTIVFTRELISSALDG